MGIQHKLFKIDNIESRAKYSGDNKVVVSNCTEPLVETLDENNAELSKLKMFQNLTGEIGEGDYKDGSWNWLTTKSYKTLVNIKSFFNINIYGTDAAKCKIIGEVDKELVDKLINSKQDLSEMMDYADRDLDMIIFYLKLAEKGMLDDFIDTFDKVSSKRCLLSNIPPLESITFQNLKKIKANIKSKYESFVFDVDYINNIFSQYESIECIGENLLKLVEIGHENYVIVNPTNFEQIRVAKTGENQYIFNANMPSSPIVARRSFVLLCQYLPEGAKIVEKESLSGDSFSLIAHLFKEQKKYNIKVSFDTSNNHKIKLNSQGKNSKLSKFIEEKNTGKDTGKIPDLFGIKSILSEFVKEKNSGGGEDLFETKSESDAEMIVNEINKMIYKYTGDENIRANVKKIERKYGKSTWTIELPSFCIEKC